MSDSTSAVQPGPSRPVFPLARSLSFGTRLLGVLLALFFTLPVPAAPGGSSPARPLFQSAATLDIVLRLPWQTIVTDEFFNQGGYPSLLEVSGQQGPVSMPVVTERRGWSRQVICRYPPLKLRFDKNEVEGTLFEGQKSLKLVIHCDQGEAYQQYLVLEALAYRMYNVVSDFSFRIRPLSVTYVDSETGKSQRPKFAFLVEDDKDVARRNGLKTLKLPAVKPELLDPLEASKLALFQFMIANSAWSLERKADEQDCCDNLKLIGDESGEAHIYAIPDDFDYSGLVNAQYARSAGKPKAGGVAARVFRGFCADNAALDEARGAFLARESDILSLVSDDTHLVESQKTRAGALLTGFFDVLKDPEQFNAQVTANCLD